MSYYTDRRVLGTDYGSHLTNVRESDMTAEYDGRRVKIKFELCGTCHGKGSHVNPSVDSHGISADEFYEDTDFAEAYIGGMYDVTCYECGGRRVTPVPTDPEVRAELYADFAADAEYAAMVAAERRMGA